MVALPPAAIVVLPTQAPSTILVNQPNVRRAIYALAESLPLVGRMSGTKAHRIIAKTLAG
jgi:hypothetical protein